MPDGFATNPGDRILVQAQVDQTTNGIYTVVTPGTGVDGSWIRSSDASTSADFVDGKEVHVGEGLSYADTEWVLTTNAPIVLGVSNIVFVLQTSPIVSSGWTRTAPVVHLTFIADRVGIGTAATPAGRKLGITATGVDKGIQFTSPLMVDNIVESLVLGSPFAPFQVLANGDLLWGDGTAAADTKLGRLAANYLAVGAGDSFVIPGPAAFLGVNVSAPVGTEVLRVVGDTQVAGNIVPDVDVLRVVGTDLLRFLRVRAEFVVAGDLCFDDPGCAICHRSFVVGERLQLEVVALEDPDGRGRVVSRTVPIHVTCSR
jgi:hypothetical protein